MSFHGGMLGVIVATCVPVMPAARVGFGPCWILSPRWRPWVWPWAPGQLYRSGAVGAPGAGALGHGVSPRSAAAAAAPVAALPVCPRGHAAVRAAAVVQPPAAPDLGGVRPVCAGLRRAALFAEFFREPDAHLGIPGLWLDDAGSDTLRAHDSAGPVHAVVCLPATRRAVHPPAEDTHAASTTISCRTFSTTACARKTAPAPAPCPYSGASSAMTWPTAFPC
jgi:hypothetical protein